MRRRFAYFVAFVMTTLTLALGGCCHHQRMHGHPGCNCQQSCGKANCKQAAPCSQAGCKPGNKPCCNQPQAEAPAVPAK